MKILITGNLGYIGSVLTAKLDRNKFEVFGFDTGYYKDCCFEKTENNFFQIFKDIREISKEDLINFDGIIHLASLSNDPLGNLNIGLTNEINYKSTVRLAKLAKENGIKRFVYASSQSMYGISTTQNELDEEDSEKNPITAYAKTKWNAELYLKNMNDDNFIVSCFRPSTVFGYSPRLRCDIVFNNLVACAYARGKIEIFSDGSPWRPVVHVEDVCDAFIAGLIAPKEIIGGKSFNVGIENGNFTVAELAMAAQNSVPGCKIFFTGEHTDPRSYKVSFKKILNELKDYFKPKWNLEKGGFQLVEYFKKINFDENHFNNRYFNRLKQLQYLQEKNSLDENLKWL